ncbi:MMPL family transporter, partial [Actinomadura sp. CNU-125]|uniref:MMPL family transporter n=1 Tax=Actinomadura sp. CNU-125 TaxID=1904961 RepID=UPI0021CC5CD6
MNRFSGFVLRHRLLVGLLWLAAACAGVLAVAQVPDRLREDFAPPGSAAVHANDAIVAAYRSGGDEKPVVPVVTLPPGTSADDPRARAVLREAFAAAERAVGGRAVSYPRTGDRGFVGDGGRTVYGLVFPRVTPGESDMADGPDPARLLDGAMRPALPDGASLRITGMDGLEEDAGGEGPSVLVETLVGGLGALVVLAFVFGSLLAVVPLLIAAVSILTSFVLVYAITGVTEVNFMVQFVVALIGLGVAVDYSLLVVTRWREERARGLDGDAATRRAMGTAGNAVVFSAAAVAIGLIAMVAVPVGFLRSVAYGGMIIPAVSALATLTLLPVVLVTAGPALDRIGPRRRATGARAGRAWTAWARRVIRFRVPAVLASVAVLGSLAFGATGMNLGEAHSGALAKSGPAHEGLAELRRAGVPSGVLTPVDVLVLRGTDPAAVAAGLRAV